VTAVLPPDLGLAWAEPAWREDGVTLMFECLIDAPRFEIRQQMLGVGPARRRLLSAVDTG
jgi:hypothetical protein